MGKTKNINNLSKEDSYNFYNYLCFYEKNIKNAYGQYDFEDSDFNDFCINNRIEPKNKKSKLDYKFYFESYTPKKSNVNDKAHHLLRHIRNSIAHGLVTKKGKNYILKDFNSKQSKETMYGIIRDDLFWTFLDKLIKTNKV